MSHKNDKAVKTMKKTKLIIKNSKRLRVNVRVRFILFYSELTPIDP